MNFYNNFLKSWNDKFPNVSEPDDLKCLKADEFFSVNDQKTAMEKLINTVSMQMFELKSRQEQLKYFNDFLKSSVGKLNTIAQIFDGKHNPMVSNGHNDESYSSNNTFLSGSANLNNNIDTNNSNMFLTSFDTGSSDLNWKPFSFSSLPINQNDRISNFSFLNGDIKLETQLPEISHFSTSFMVPTMKSDNENSKINSNFDMHVDASRRPFKCNQCDRAFAQRNGLEAHLKLHTGERPYECHLCGRAFKLKAQLQTHERVHSGERPFGCKICGKLFRQQCHVVQHLRSHTDEKPHQCEKCGKGFRQKHSLLSHEKRQCQTRQSRRMLPAGTTMWIGLSDVPGGSLTKELRPSSDNAVVTTVGIGVVENNNNSSSQVNDTAWSQSCSTGADDSSSVDTHDD